MELSDSIKKNIIQAAELPATAKGSTGVYLKYRNPSEELINTLNEAGINLVETERIETFFVPNEVLERFRNEVEMIKRRVNLKDIIQWCSESSCVYCEFSKGGKCIFREIPALWNVDEIRKCCEEAGLGKEVNDE